MTEVPKEPVPESSSEQPSEIEKLRNEFQEQFATMKASFESELTKSTEEISRLTKENEELHRALVRSAQLPPAEVPVQKTEEDLRAEFVKKYAEKAIAIEKQRGP